MKTNASGMASISHGSVSVVLGQLIWYNVRLLGIQIHGKCYPGGHDRSPIAYIMALLKHVRLIGHKQGQN